MVAELGDQDVGEEPRPGAAALDRPGWQRRLHEPLATPAGEARARGAGHDEAPGDGLELLGDILAQAPQAAPAPRAGVLAGRDLHPMRGTWSGIGRRFGGRAFSSSSSSGRRSRSMIAPAATSVASAVVV